MFYVLKPIYTKVGEFFRVDWETIGTAVDMEDAKRRYGGHPVLEAVQ